MIILEGVADGQCISNPNLLSLSIRGCGQEGSDDRLTEFAAEPKGEEREVVLSGGRNLTLRTLAGLVDALGYRVTITVSKDRDRMSVSSQSPDFKVSNIESWSSHWIRKA